MNVYTTYVDIYINLPDNPEINAPNINIWTKYKGVIIA
jgi:hypothetical protein